MKDYELDRAVQEKMAASGKLGGTQTSDNACGAELFRDRMQNRLRHARREGNKAAQIDELLFLLDKNPEVARILDLVEAVGK